MPPLFSLHDVSATLLRRTSTFSSRRISIGVVILTLIFASLYLGGLFWVYRKERAPQKAVYKIFSATFEQYALAFSAFLVLFSLVEAAISSWLLLVYHYTKNQGLPNFDTRTGLRLLLFTAICTAIAATLYALLILHPAWSTNPTSSISAQAIWVGTTWIFWVAGVGTLQSSLPALFEGASCWGIIYCQQLQASFAMAVLQILVLTFGLLALAVLGWRSRPRFSNNPG